MLYKLFFIKYIQLDEDFNNILFCIRKHPSFINITMYFVLSYSLLHFKQFYGRCEKFYIKN